MESTQSEIINSTIPSIEENQEKVPDTASILDSEREAQKNITDMDTKELEASLQTQDKQAINTIYDELAELGVDQFDDKPVFGEELRRRDEDKEIVIYGTTHQKEIDDQLQEIVAEMRNSPSDVYLVEVEPSKLEDVYSYPSADEAFTALGESAYIAWLAHAMGKEVTSWDIPYIQQLDEGMRTTSVESVVGSVIGQGLIHVLKREEMGEIGNRAEVLLSTIKTGLGEEVFSFMESKLGQELDGELIREIVSIYTPYSFDTLTLSEVTEMIRPDKEGIINNANRACNEMRDTHAIQLISEIKERDNVTKITAITGRDHIPKWKESITKLFPEALENKDEVERSLEEEPQYTSLSLEGLWRKYHQEKYGVDPVEELIEKKRQVLLDIPTDDIRRSRIDARKFERLTTLNLDLAEAGFPINQLYYLHDLLPHSNDFFATEEYKKALLQSAIQLREFIENGHHDQEIREENRLYEVNSLKNKIRTRLQGSLLGSNANKLDRTSTLYKLIHAKSLDEFDPDTSISSNDIEVFERDLKDLLRSHGIEEENLAAAYQFFADAYAIPELSDSQIDETLSVLGSDDLDHLISFMKDNKQLTEGLTYQLDAYVKLLQSVEEYKSRDIKTLSHEVWSNHPDRYNLDRLKATYYKSVLSQISEDRLNTEQYIRMQEILGRIDAGDELSIYDSELSSIVSELADRDNNEENGRGKVSGFEFYPDLRYNNDTISEILQSATPVGISSDEMKLEYFDYSKLRVMLQGFDMNSYEYEGEKTTSVGVVGADISKSHIRLYLDDRQVKAELSGQEINTDSQIIELESILRHEMAHAWFADIYDDDDKLSIIVNLLENDYNNGNDVFNSEISNYHPDAVENFRMNHKRGEYIRTDFLKGGEQRELAKKMMRHISEDPYILVNESIAAIWEHSANPEKLKRMEDELPGHYEVYKCMSHEGYIDSHLQAMAAD